MGRRQDPEADGAGPAKLPEVKLGLRRASTKTSRNTGKPSPILSGESGQRWVGEGRVPGHPKGPFPQRHSTQTHLPSFYSQQYETTRVSKGGSREQATCRWGTPSQGAPHHPVGCRLRLSEEQQDQARGSGALSGKPKCDPRSLGPRWRRGEQIPAAAL